MRGTDGYGATGALRVPRWHEVCGESDKITGLLVTVRDPSEPEGHQNLLVFSG